MEEKEEKGFGDEAAVGPLPRWETLESGDEDGKWWQSLPQPLPWFRRQGRVGPASRTRKLKEELQRLVARQERKKWVHDTIFNRSFFESRTVQVQNVKASHARRF